MNKNISKKVRLILSFPFYLVYTRFVAPIYEKRMATYMASFCNRRGKVLDVGCDDGRIAELIMEQNPALKVTGIDIQSIRKARIQRVIYDGKRIPYPDNSFETVIAVNVLHHTKDIKGLLKDMGRVSKKYVVIKDHRRYGWPSFMLISFFDLLGNFRFGIRCVFNYPSLEEWNLYFKEAGLRCVSMPKKLNFGFFVGSRYNPIFQLKKI